MYENYLWTNAGMNVSAVFPQIHAQTSPVFLSRPFGTSVEMSQTFHRHLAACIKKTTRLLRKDSLAGYRYKKTAVITCNKHYALNGLIML